MAPSRTFELPQMIYLWGFLIKVQKLALEMGISLVEKNKAEEDAESEEEVNCMEEEACEMGE